MMKALMLAAGALVAIASTAHAAPKTVYIAPDDHTDYMWAGTEAQYRSYFPRALDAYLDQMDATASAPSDQQARWIHRANGNRELVRVTNGRALNDFGAGTGIATLEGNRVATYRLSLRP